MFLKKIALCQNGSRKLLTLTP